MCTDRQPRTEIRVTFTMGRRALMRIVTRSRPYRHAERSVLAKMSPPRYSVLRMKASNQSCESTGISACKTSRALRLEARLTQAQLAVRLGITQSAIAQIEGGQYRTGLETINRLVTTRDCPTHMLLDQMRGA